MKKSNSIILGILLILAGVLVALSAFNIADVHIIFFDGWWTLFIIVPCTVGLFTERQKTGNIIGILIGVFLLLCCQDVVSFDMIWKLLIPAIITVIGVKLVFGGVFGNKANEIMTDMKEKGNEPEVGFAVFSGKDMNYDGEVFEGAELTAVFGGVKCDLRNAIITKDCAVRVSAIFGGITIFVPDNVNVKVNSTSIFGGVSNKTRINRENTITIYVSGSCMFGGVDIK